MTDTFARQRQLIGTTAAWGANDLIIGDGELALERVAGGAVRMKLGNGVDKFSVLPYFDPGIFDFVLKGGDTMTGPLIVPELSVVDEPANFAHGIVVAAGPSSFAGAVDLGAGATVAEPAPNDNDQTVPSTHWVMQKVGGIITGLSLKGTWNAATNTPPLASGGAGIPTPLRGDFYLVSVAGSTTLDGISTWNVGDSVVFNGVSWQRVPQTLFTEQIVAALGYTPADEADLAALEAAVTTLNGDAIKRQIVDAAGDLIVGTAADTVARLAKGANNSFLRVSGAGALQWSGDGVMTLYSEVVSVAGAVDMNVSWPATAKRVEIEFGISTNDNSSQALACQLHNNGTPYGSASYNMQYSYGSGTTVAAAKSSDAATSGYWILGNGAWWKGVLRPWLIPSNVVAIEGNGWGLAGSSHYAITWGGNNTTLASSNCNGMRLSWVSATQLRAGSFMRAYVVT